MNPLVSCAAYRSRKESGGNDELYAKVERLIAEMNGRYDRFLSENSAYIDLALNDGCCDMIILEKRVWLTALNLRAACRHLVIGSVA